MSTDQENLQPLSFEDDKELKPLSTDAPIHENNMEFVPLAKATEIKNKDSNFIFFFGDAGTGKSVILSAMLYYMRSQAGVVRPKLGTPNSRDAQVLLSDFFENIRQGVLPNRSDRDRVIRLDLVFEPNNKSQKVPPVNLTFLEMSGENHKEIRRGGNYHSSIDSYLNANIPLTFIIVTSYESAHRDDVLINEFLDELERKNKNLRSVNAILLVSKWDKSGRTDVDNAEELDNFIYERLPMTAQRIDTYRLSKSYFTIGTIVPVGGIDKISVLNLDTAEVLSKWLYKSIVGYDLDYPGTFWERIKFSFSNNE